MLIKNIIWDWNGTIVNDAPLFANTMNVLLKEIRSLGINIDLGLENKKT